MNKWKKIKIGEIFSVEKGSLQSSKNIPGQYNFITASQDWKTHNSFTHDCEAILIAVAASGSLGRTHYVNGKFIASDLCFILTPNDNYKGNIDLKFYYRLFTFIRNELVNQTATGTSKRAINITNFSNYPVPFCEISEQIKIGKKLEKLVLKSEVYLKQNQLLQDYLFQLKNIILEKAFQGKLVPQDPDDEPAEKIIKQRARIPLPSKEIPFNIPKGWVWARLEEITSQLGDGLHGTPLFSENGEYYFINGNNLNNGSIIIKSNTKKVNSSEFNKYRKSLGKNTILISINGTLGNIAFYNNEKVILGKSACYFNLLDNFDKNYIKIILSSTYFLDYSTKSATRTTIRNISLKSMRSFLIPIPPINEQKRIVKKVDELMRVCDDLEKKLKESKNNIERLSESILQESFIN